MARPFDAPPRKDIPACGAPVCAFEALDTRKLFPSPFLSDLAGMGEARKWGEALRDDLRAYKDGKLAWDDVDPGCVLHGPPGTGKTTFAKALANSCFLKLVSASFGDWQSSGEGHLGTLTSAMTKAFAEARSKAPCIFFIDELDSIPVRGGGGHHAQYWNVAVNHLLKLLDGLSEMKGVVIVAACNHPELLDPALVRAGRLDRKIAIGLPTIADFPQIIRFHLKKDAEHIGDLSTIALFCAGMSGADIEKLVREARRSARRAGRPVHSQDLIETLEASAPKLAPGERRRVAVHEAGHAVVAIRLGLSTDVNLSLVSANGSSGQMILSQQHRVLTRSLVEDQLAMLLAGRAAEEAYLSSVSGGAGGSDQSDLAQATRLASRSLAVLGLSAGDDLRWCGDKEAQSIWLSPFAAELKVMLAGAYARALELIRKDLVYVNNVARALNTHRALSHKDIVDLDPLSHKTTLPFIARLKK